LEELAGGNKTTTYGKWSFVEGSSAKTAPQGASVDLELGYLGTCESKQEEEMVGMVSVALTFLTKWYDCGYPAGPRKVLLGVPNAPWACLSKYEGGSDVVYRPNEAENNGRSAFQATVKDHNENRVALTLLAEYVKSEKVSIWSDCAARLLMFGDAVVYLPPPLLTPPPQYLKGALYSETLEVWRRAVLMGAGVPSFQLKDNAMCFVGSDDTCAGIVRDWIVGGVARSAVCAFEDPAFVAASVQSLDPALACGIKVSADIAESIANVWEIWGEKSNDGVAFEATRKRLIENPALFKLLSASLNTDLAALKQELVKERDPADIIEYTHYLRFISSTLRVFAVEIHGSTTLPKQLASFLESASSASKYQEWTKSFMTYDDATLRDLESTADVFSAFKNCGLYIEPNAFDKPDGCYDLTKASSVLRPCLSDTARYDFVMDTMARHNATFVLASEQAALIRSWRRFMEVCVLRHGESEAAKSETPSTPRMSPVAHTSPGRKRTSSGADEAAATKAALLATPPAQQQVPTSPGRSAGSSFSGDFRSHAMVMHVAQALACENSEAMVPSGNDSYNNDQHQTLVGTYSGAVVAAEMAEGLVSMLHHQLHVVVEKASDPAMTKTEMRRSSRMFGTEKCAAMLHNIEGAARRLFKATEPVLVNRGAARSGAEEKAKKAAYDLGCRMRLRLLTAAVLLARAMGPHKDVSVQSLSDINACKARLVERACDTLKLLRCGESEGGQYSYSFVSGGGGGMGEEGMDVVAEEEEGESAGLGLDLLRTCVTLLTVLLPDPEQPQSGVMYTQSLRRSGGVQSVLFHLGCASGHAAGGGKGRENAVGVTKGLFTFLFAASSSCYDVATLLSEEGLQREICANELLKQATGGWARLTGGEMECRGYVSVVEEEKGEGSGEGRGGGGYNYLETQTKYTTSNVVDEVSTTYTHLWSTTKEAV